MTKYIILKEEPLIMIQEDQPVMTAMSYQKFESLMETLDILADQAFSQKLKASIDQVKRGETLPWETAKEKLRI